MLSTMSSPFVITTSRGVRVLQCFVVSELILLEIEYQDLTHLNSSLTSSSLHFRILTFVTFRLDPINGI